MADKSIRLPSSSAGITTFTEEYSSRVMLSPNQVLIFIGVIAFFVILLHVIG